MKNEIKALAELKQHCIDNPTQLDKLLEYKYRCQAFDWSYVLDYVTHLENVIDNNTKEK